MGIRYNYDNGIPCKNPNCRSYGRPHPNCRCGGGGLGATAGRLWERAKGAASGFAESYGNSASHEGYASGGLVDGETHFCTTGGAHEEGCEHFASGGQVEDQQHFAKDPALSVDHAVLDRGLHHVMTKTGKRGGGDFMEHAKRGRKTLDNHAKNLLNPKSDPVSINPEDVDALERHLEELRMNPSAAENVGGDLGNSFPDHQLHLTGKLASVANYFDAIRPKSAQGAPLDKVMPPSKKELMHYRRQLAIAQNPALIYQKAKDAQLQPGDRETLQAIYPRLHQDMVNRAGGAIVDAKHAGVELPKHAKRGLGQLMGQDLGFIHTPAAMQAIMQANALTNPQAAPGKPAQKARNKAIDESNKMAQLEATADQAREFRKNK